MLATLPHTILLASHDPALLASVEPALSATGASVEIVLSAEAAWSVITSPDPPALALLDAELPPIAPDRNLANLLASARASIGGHRFPVVLLSDAVTDEWSRLLAEGVLDDVIPRAVQSPLGRMRLDIVLRTHHRMRELDRLREAVALDAQLDPLTGIYNRATLLSMLFRETDRVQRMKTPLCLILFDIDDFGHWNSRLGVEACDDLLCQLAARATRLLRSYDLLGRLGNDEFLVVLPGCGTDDAVMLTERLRFDIFAAPFHVAGEAIRLSASFGIASSQGRSPVVVLREAEQALHQAKDAGPESIRCFTSDARNIASPVAFLSPSSGDELLAW